MELTLRDRIFMSLELQRKVESMIKNNNRTQINSFRYYQREIERLPPKVTKLILQEWRKQCIQK